MEFPPILILFVLWLFLGPLLAKAKKTAEQQQKKKDNTTAAKQGTPQKSAARRPAARPEKPMDAGEYEPFAHNTVLQPTISVTEHDDSVYRGSLNAETGEGYDPCHEEQLEPLTLAETAVPAAETAEGGLRLGWTGDEIVRGFVMSEILKRKRY